MTGYFIIFLPLIGFFLGFLLSFLIFRRRGKANTHTDDNMHELALALAHEIRNPLSAIRMNMQLIGEEMSEQEHYAKRFSTIEDELLRLDRILKSFLEYSKLPTPRFQRVDINDTVRSTVDIIRPRSRNVLIDIRLADTLPPMRADPTLIKELLHNIIQNAIDSYSDDGNTTDESNTVIIETMRIPRGVSIAVTDNGKGISPELLDKVFKPYFSTKSGGMGIGMAVVKKMVEAHGGKIRVQSRKGGGTRVVVEMPGL